MLVLKTTEDKLKLYLCVVELKEGGMPPFLKVLSLLSTVLCIIKWVGTLLAIFWLILGSLWEEERLDCVLGDWVGVGFNSAMSMLIRV